MSGPKQATEATGFRVTRCERSVPDAELRARIDATINGRLADDLCERIGSDTDGSNGMCWEDRNWHVVHRLFGAFTLESFGYDPELSGSVLLAEDHTGDNAGTVVRLDWKDTEYRSGEERLLLILPHLLRCPPLQDTSA